MVAAKTILLVASESAFRRSLEFALEVEGFSVESHALLSEAEESPAAAIALCAVVDEGVLRSRAGPPVSLARITRPVILLANELSATVACKGLTILTKPLRGNDLVDVLHGLSAV
ncbi:transcriptional regulator [Mesorhizobium sp. M1312]|uniref:transcriptional regulator n=1 Tax=unclassified Mesorhizobium TaxID=325217 RepID=UPI003335C1E9